MSETPAPERTTAETLTEAAEKLRRLALQADSGPWETTWRGQEYHLDGYRAGDLTPVSEWTYAIATWEPKVHDERVDCDTANADYIAAVHPGVGTALADWLDHEAKLIDQVPGAEHPDRSERALAVARLILGEAA